MGDDVTSGTDRRTFLKQATGTMLAAGISARSYGRILGANDRIHVAQLGCGGRSMGHVRMIQLSSQQTPVETMAVCDIWSLAREARAAQVKATFNLEPQTYKYSEEMLANKDIDAVMIATGDFQHAKLCAEVVRAGKDCYVEKPFANVLSEAKETRDLVKGSKQMVQMGSQHRSEPYQLAVRDLVRSGRIGEVVHIEQEWNVNMERWRWVNADTGGGPGAGRGGGMAAAYAAATPEQREKMIAERSASMGEQTMAKYANWHQELYDSPSKLREEDTDWNRWLLGKPHRPFDPHVYLEFRLYKDYSSGIFDQWMSHGSDLVHLWTDSDYPESVVANGGVFAWKDDRENPDTAVAAVTYPKGFLYTYKTTFGNSFRSFSRIQGRKGTIANYGGEGASLFTVSKEGGPHEGAEVNYKGMPIVAPAKDEEEVVIVPGAPPPDSRGPGDDSVVHVMNWLSSIRSRVPPNANVDHGFSHAVVIIMAAHSYWSGKKLYWNPQTEEIVDHPIADKKKEVAG